MYVVSDYDGLDMFISSGCMLLALALIGDTVADYYELDMFISSGCMSFA